MALIVKKIRMVEHVFDRRGGHVIKDHEYLEKGQDLIYELL